jgi:exodeoxyribonuclease-3
VRVISAYVPNGQAVGSEKFLYKLQWLGRCREWLKKNAAPSTPLALCGDFNVAPDDRDVCDPEAWKDQVLCHPDERAAFFALLDCGLADVFRRHHPESGVFSWWDYRQLSFPRNKGLRIDHILATQALATRSCDAFVDRNARKGQDPSDHAPVVALFD